MIRAMGEHTALPMRCHCARLLPGMRAAATLSGSGKPMRRQPWAVVSVCLGVKVHTPLPTAVPVMVGQGAAHVSIVGDAEVGADAAEQVEGVDVAHQSRSLSEGRAGSGSDSACGWTVVTVPTVPGVARVYVCVERGEETDLRV